MHFKGPLKIPLVNSFVKLIPAQFLISRLERAIPKGRGLVGPPPHVTKPPPIGLDRSKRAV